MSRTAPGNRVSAMSNTLSEFFPFTWTNTSVGMASKGAT